MFRNRLEGRLDSIATRPKRIGGTMAQKAFATTKLGILVVTITLAVTFLFVNTGTVRSANPDFPEGLVKGARIVAHDQSRGALQFVIQETRGSWILATDIRDEDVPSGSQTWVNINAYSYVVVLPAQQKPQ
jgi:hypothetical protein